MPSTARLALAYIVIFTLFMVVRCHPLDLIPTNNMNVPAPTIPYLHSRAEPIPQGTASDGSGTVGSPAYIIWTAFCFAAGAPLAIAGVRGWRLSIGLALGCGGAGCAWAAVNNAVNEHDLPDLVIVAIVFGFFFLGFILGLFEFARQGGILVLAITGGLAFGIRIVLFRENLLVPIYWVNWLIVGVFGLLLPLGFIIFNRLIIVSSCASLGTFLIAIGVDLIVNKEDGLSRGLRFLFDRNKNHSQDINKNGYHPELSTLIILAVTLGITPALAYFQHLVFKQPFDRTKETPLVTESKNHQDNEEEEAEYEDTAPLPSRYSRYPSLKRMLGRDKPPSNKLLPNSQSRFSL